MNDEGARRFGARWLQANEAVIQTARRLGMDYTTQENKRLLVAMALTMAELFLPEEVEPVTEVQGE